MIQNLHGLLHALNPVKFAVQCLGLQPDPKQALVLGHTARRGLLNCSRQWGKSTITAAKAVHRAVCQPGSLIVVLTPSARQSGEFVRKAAGFLQRLDIRQRGDGDNELSLLFPNGSRIVGLPGAEGTIRGFSAVSLLLIDEAARVSDESYKAASPMRAVGDGDLWLMSTPFGKRGFFWDIWAGPDLRWERIQAPATECPRISPDFLAQERESLGDRWFRQEYMCEFVSDDESLFDRDLIDAALDPDLEPLFL